MQRETKSLTTPVSNLEVVYYTYLLGRDYEYVQEPLLEAMQMSPTASGDMKFGNLDTGKMRESTHRLVERLVKSIDGKSENVLEAFLDLPRTDYETVLDVLNELNNDKKKLDRSTTTTS